MIGVTLGNPDDEEDSAPKEVHVSFRSTAPQADPAAVQDSNTPTERNSDVMPLPVDPGALFLGKYRIERLLGRGGMGVVMAAHHEGLDQRVAIKFLGWGSSSQKVALQRFEREARAAARIQNEHVARVFDVGVHDGGMAYMIMEYLEGSDLGQVLEQRGPLPLTEAVDYVVQALDGLSDAHAAGIVHRDLKPSNLFLCRRPNGSLGVKVLDFGSAQSETAPASGAESLTSPQSIMGSPRYMSPEQIRSTKTADRRSDIWSVGVILYELLTGGAPFDGETTTELFAAVLMDQPRPPREFRAELPIALESVILRCLSRDREARYGSAAELAQALLPFGSSQAQIVVTRLVANLPLPVGSAQDALATKPTLPSAGEAGKITPGSGVVGAATDTTWTPAAERRNKSSMPIAAIALVLAAVAAVAGWVLWTRLRAAEVTGAEQPTVTAVPSAASPLPPVVAPAITPSPVAQPEASTPSAAPATAAASATAAPLVTAARKPTKKPTATAAPAPKSKSSVLEGRE